MILRVRPPHIVLFVRSVGYLDERTESFLWFATLVIACCVILALFIWWVKWNTVVHYINSVMILRVRPPHIVLFVRSVGYLADWENVFFALVGSFIIALWAILIFVVIHFVLKFWWTMKYCNALRKFCDDSDVCKNCLDLLAWNNERRSTPMRRAARARAARRALFLEKKK